MACRIYSGPGERPSGLEAAANKPITANRANEDCLHERGGKNARHRLPGNVPEQFQCGHNSILPVSEDEDGGFSGAGFMATQRLVRRYPPTPRSGLRRRHMPRVFCKPVSQIVANFSAIREGVRTRRAGDSSVARVARLFCCLRE
ncbi:MAG: hypothetical protein NZ558_01685 [Blastocatellia bacterium]|nr:hypothetical protein [Blastocatellia bacterium]